MIEGSLLMSLTPGITSIMLSWWFTKRRFPFFVRLLLTILLIVAACIIFYIGYVHVRGFQGGAYLHLSFLIIFATVVRGILFKYRNRKNIY